MYTWVEQTLIKIVELYIPFAVLTGGVMAAVFLLIKQRVEIVLKKSLSQEK